MVKKFIKWFSFAICFSFTFSMFLVGLIISVCALLNLSLNEFNFIMDIFQYSPSILLIIVLILTSKKYMK